MTWVMGLTGGIGSGKSLASHFFSQAGLPVVDADQVSRDLTGPHQIGSLAVAQCFGPQCLGPDGAMDRHRMRELVFRNPLAKEKLENCLHPLITTALQEALEAAKAQSPWVIFDCPLLVQNPTWLTWVDRIVVIDASIPTRIQRILTRPGLTESTARAIIAQQPSRQHFLSIANDILQNETSAQDLENAVNALCQQWREQYPA